MDAILEKYSNDILLQKIYAALEANRKKWKWNCYNKTASYLGITMIFSAEYLNSYLNDEETIFAAMESLQQTIALVNKCKISGTKELAKLYKHVENKLTKNIKVDSRITFPLVKLQISDKIYDLSAVNAKSSILPDCTFEITCLLIESCLAK